MCLFQDAFVPMFSFLTLLISLDLSSKVELKYCGNDTQNCGSPSFVFYLIPSHFNPRYFHCSKQAVCPQPKKSDAFHLAVNLMDRFLGYKPPSDDEQFRTVACACTMISMKIRRARKECLSNDMLRKHFYGISEKKVKVRESWCNVLLE